MSLGCYPSEAAAVEAVGLLHGILAGRAAGSFDMMRGLADEDLWAAVEAAQDVLRLVMADVHRRIRGDEPVAP